MNLLMNPICVLICQTQTNLLSLSSTGHSGSSLRPGTPGWSGERR